MDDVEAAIEPYSVDDILKALVSRYESLGGRGDVIMKHWS